MSSLSRFLNHSFGIPETHIQSPMTLAAIEKMSEDELTKLAAHLNADEARALSIAGTMIHTVAEKRYAEVTGQATGTP